MNWKVCYKKEIESGEEIKTVGDVEKTGLTQLKVEFPASIPDNTNCFYSAVFSAYEYDYLLIEGIDAIAEIFVNGKKVATTDTNYKTLEITDGIIVGENEVVVFVHPKFGKASVIRNISLKRRRKCELQNVNFKTLAIDDVNDIATVGVTADIKIRDDSTHDFGNLSYKIILKDEKKSCVQEGALGYNHVDEKVEIQRPRIWWPKNYGKSVLYDAQLIIYDSTRELDVFDMKFPIVLVENNIGSSVVNGKNVCLSGPVVSSFTSESALIEKLDALGANLCILPKSYESMDNELREAFYEHGIVVNFKNVVPESKQSADEIKKAIENYRIKKMYQPIWEIPDDKTDFSLIHDVNQPLCLAIEDKTNDLYCVSDLTYLEKITYIVKDMSSNEKIVAMGILDVEPGTVKFIEKIATTSGHNYQISWTTSSGKMHLNTFN